MNIEHQQIEYDSCKIICCFSFFPQLSSALPCLRSLSSINILTNKYKTEYAFIEHVSI